MILASLAVIGNSSRRFSAAHTVYTVNKPEEAFIHWNNLGLKGRTILIFDRHLSIATVPQNKITELLSSPQASSELNSDNFLYLSFHANIVRKVYHIVPDNAWGDVKQALSRYPFVLYDGKRFRLTIEGVPVIVTRLNDLPELTERVLVYLNNAYKTQYEPYGLNAFLEDPRRADVVVLNETGLKEQKE